MERAEYRIGIDLGGTNIKVGVTTPAGELLGKLSAKTRPIGRGWQEVVADMAKLVELLLAQLAIDIDACTGIGVGSPGMVDHKGGVVVFAGNFDWENVPLLGELRRYFALPMRLANDANCAVLGEVVCGAAKGSRDVVLLTLGTGVGGGVIAGGVLQEGGFAGGMELGHALLVMDGERCTCGRDGCLESYASASALIRHAQQAARKNTSSLMWKLCEGELDNMNGKVPFDAADLGDETAAQVVQNYIKYLGEGIINYINIWRPEKVLLGGGISNQGDSLINPLNEYVAPRAFAGEHGYVAPVVRAELGGDAGMIGAAALLGDGMV